MNTRGRKSPENMQPWLMPLRMKKKSLRRACSPLEWYKESKNGKHLWHARAGNHKDAPILCNAGKTSFDAEMESEWVMKLEKSRA